MGKLYNYGSEMNFASDNTSPVPTQILEKINDVNHWYQISYGEDDYIRELTDRIKNQGFLL